MNKRSKLVLIAGLGLILLFTSCRMYMLWQAEGFWGYWPLVFFLSIWGIWVLLREKSLTKVTGDWRLLGWASLTGVLLALGFPPVPLTPLLFIAFVPLLWVEKVIKEKNQGRTGRQVFKYCYQSFVLWNILVTYWVTNTAFIAGIVAIFMNALFMTIPFVLFHYTHKLLNRKLAYLAFIAYWLSYEFGHQRWEISWSWLTLGNGLAKVPGWIQWYEFTGVFGGGLWILVANVIAFHLVEKILHNGSWNFSFAERDQKKYLIQFLVVLLLPIGISLLMYHNYEEEGPEVEVVAVQPNFDPHYEKFDLSPQVQLQRFISLSQQQVTDSTQYLLFPETSFGGIRLDQLLQDQKIATLKSFVDRYPNLKLITGIGAHQIFPNGISDTEIPALRTQVRSTDTIYWEAYNAAIQLESGSTKVPVYYKSVLVPGAEFMPYDEVFFFLKPLSDALGGTLVGYGRQRNREVFFADGTAVAPVICYESVYGEFTTGYIRNGAQAIFIVTNDGWWDKTAGYQQHLLFGRLRAIETRRSIGRSANIGTCAFINQRGDILQPTKYGVPAAIRGRIHFNDAITFYTRMGDMIGRLALFTTILLLLNSFVKGRLKT